MSEKAKLIWDFRGPAATQTAQHHLIHLKEFFQAEDYKSYQTDTQAHSEMWSSAFVVVDLDAVTDLRNRLKPHRGQKIEFPT